MKAGVAGAVAISGAVVGALTWSYLALVQPVPSDPSVAPSGSAVRPTVAPDAVPADAADGSPGGVAQGAVGGAASTAPQRAGRPSPVARPDRVAAIAPEAAGTANPLPGTEVARPVAPDEPKADASAPSFDVVRVDADGQTVIAGRTAPNERVEVLLDGQVVETLLADAGGRFVAVLAAGRSSAARELRLRVTLSDAPRAPASGDEPSRPAGETSRGAPPAARLGEALEPGGSPAPATAPAGVAAPSDRPRGGDAAGLARPASPAVDPGAPATASDAAGAPSGPSPFAASAEGAATAPRPVPADAGASAPGAPAGPAEKRFLLSEPVIILPAERSGDAPALVQSQGDELAMLQPGGAKASGVVLDQLTQQPDGNLLLRGRARPGHAVRIYGNGQPIETVVVDDGGWSVTLPAARAGDIRLFRLDEIARSGAVASRVEVPFEPAGPVSQVVRDRRITVRRGDNLWRIAEQHYGEGIRYSLIFGANSDLIRDPDLIYPDQVFSVPELVEAE